MTVSPILRDFATAAPKRQPTTGPAEGESLAAWAKRCWERQSWETRSQRANQLLRLIERVVSWPADRVSVVYDSKHDAFAWIDDLMFRCIGDASGDHLLVAGDDSWHEVTSAAELSALMSSGRLRGMGA